jgi:hypothetical protein
MQKLLTWSILVFALTAAPVQAHDGRVNVVVWDRYFNPTHPSLHVPGNGTIGESLALEPHGTTTQTSTHGRDVTLTIVRARPFVTVFPVSDLFPWQDPEICLLVPHPAFAGKLPACRQAAEEGMERLNRFIKQHHIRLVNISHGTYYPRYIQQNPALLKNAFPEVSQEHIDAMLWQNFLAIGNIFEIVVKANPEVLFVVAAGSNYNGDIDTHPAWYGNLSKKYDNVFTVTSTFDDRIVENAINWGKESVDVVINVSGHRVPRDAGEPAFFTGSSAAVAVAVGMFSAAIQQFGNRLTLTPALLKSVGRTVAAEHTTHPYFRDKVVSGGVLRESELLAHLAKLAHQKEPALSSAARAATPANGAHAPHSAAIVITPELQPGNFTLYEVPADLQPRDNSGRSCEQIRQDAHGVLWMTFPYVDTVASLEPQSKTWRRYPLRGVTIIGTKSCAKPPHPIPRC